MTGQLSLFGARVDPAGARPIYATPRRCERCPAEGLIYSRSYGPDGAPVDRCASCTATEVRRLRAEGLPVPSGFEWVV